MGFSLGSIISPLTNPVQTVKDIFGNIVPQRPNAPNLPPAPTLTAPQLPQYPGFSPQQQQLLQQQQGYLQGAQGAQGAYQNNPYLQASQGADMQALTNYQNALQGKIAPNQMISQQKQQDWAALKQQAGQLGIQLSGDTPERAASQSTAGNQMITDFNKRYGALEQNYNLGQQQMGFMAQGQALGQQNTQFQNQMGGYQNLQGMNQGIFNPYQQQQMGQYGQQTQQALANSDTSNQNLMNQYNQQTGQQMVNYNNGMAGYNANMGLLQSGLGLAGNILGGAAAARTGTNNVPNTNMGLTNNGTANPLNAYNPGQSYTQSYQPRS
jgi:hypothetical protein